MNTQKGVAILLVMTSIVFLIMILATLTYETELNKIRVYNTQDKFQARLNAESGITFAMAQLNIYRKARNLLEKNKKNSIISPQDLENILKIPFVFPPPLPKEANLIQKNAINEFIEKTLLKGELSLNITPLAGFLNPNNLRIIKRDKENPEEENVMLAYNEQLFIDAASSIIEEFKELDIYGNLSDIEPRLLIKELKFFVNHPDDFEDSEKNLLENMYNEKEVTPKHAPLVSLSELHLLQGWDDLIIEKMKKKMNTHQISIIPVNELTEGQLKVFFPEISEDQIKEFFVHRDGDIENNIEGREFSSIDQFEELIISTLGVTDKTDFDKLVSDLEASGMQFGMAGNLYQIISRGEYGRSIYTLKALVSIPVRPKIKTKEDSSKKSDAEKPDPPPIQFFSPRIVEIEII